ncbi:hypothetical protein SAMN05518669_103426 [Variovorax sp. YR634]|uniref:hypothetical protein n=1 Tax=Variovorax sp. YR634 TaxID=1884385 RepID=UPI0008974171|nr:hypothetical protein [Variovorax sp. YR634]SDX15768.1 hypothetical protein SAMN05518669_103426 [Variovorax sp. YR634]
MTTNDKTVGDERDALMRLMELADDYALAFRAMECVTDNSDSDEERSALEEALRASLTTPSKEPAGAVAAEREAFEAWFCEEGDYEPEWLFGRETSAGWSYSNADTENMWQAYAKGRMDERAALATPGAAIDAREQEDAYSDPTCQRAQALNRAWDAGFEAGQKVSPAVDAGEKEALVQISGLLSSMFVSARAHVRGEDEEVVGYTVRTGALHKIVGLLASYKPVIIPSNLPTAHETITGILTGTSDSREEAPTASAHEPWQHVANEWADMATNAMQGVRNIIDGITKPEDVIANLNFCYSHCAEVQSRAKLPATVAQPVADEVKRLREALQFYADGNHFTQHQPDAWDTVSGEPSNFYEDESNTATVEDGSVAKMALAAQPCPSQGCAKEGDK